MRHLVWLTAIVSIGWAATACSTWSGGPGVDNGGGSGGGEAGSGGTDQEIGLVAKPADVYFADAVVGSSYETTVRLVNDGARDATIEAIIGWNDADWSAWSFGIPETPVRLAPGEFVELSLRYAPTVAGGSSGEVWIETETSFEAVIRMRGRATLPPTAQVTEELDFGALDPGEERTLPVVVRNVGTGVLKVVGASVSGDQFTLGEIEVPVALDSFEASGSWLEIPISFTPSIPNGGYPDYGTLTLELEGGVRPAIDVNLVGSCTMVIEPPPF